MKWKQGDGNSPEDDINIVCISSISETTLNGHTNGSVQTGINRQRPRSSSRPRLRTISSENIENHGGSIERGRQEEDHQIRTVSERIPQFDLTDGGLPSFATYKTLERQRRPSERDYFRKKEKRRAEWWLVLVSSSLGLGNLWRFPNVAYEYGGGAFLFAYVLVVLIIAFPICFLELSLGQFCSGTIGSVWKCLPVLKGVIPGQKIVTVYLAVLLGHVTSYSLSFTYEAFRGPLLDQSMYRENNSEVLINEVLKGGPWQLTESETKVVYLENLNVTVAVCEVIVWTIVFLTFLLPRIMKKAFLVTSIFPPVCFVSCLIYSLLQSGAVDGVKVFFMPRWEDLKDVNIWYAAAQQAFFSLGIGFGHLVIFSQFNDFKHKVFRDTIFICLVDTLISMAAGCLLFAILGHVFDVTGIDLEKGFHNLTSESDYGLSFQSYSVILSTIQTPILVEFCSVIFFFAITILGLGNLVPVVDSLFDKPNEGKRSAKLKRYFFCFLVCVLGCAFGMFICTDIGPKIMIAIDHYGVGASIIVFAIVQCIGLMYGYGAKNITDDLTFMLERTFDYHWRIVWAFIAPFGLTVVFIYYHSLNIKEEFGSLWLGLGWALIIFAISQIIIWIFFTYRDSSEYEFKKKLVSLVRVESDWGPSDPIHLHKWRKYKEDQSATGNDSARSTLRRGQINKAFEEEIADSRDVQLSVVDTAM